MPTEVFALGIVQHVEDTQYPAMYIQMCINAILQPLSDEAVQQLVTMQSASAWGGNKGRCSMTQIQCNKAQEQLETMQYQRKKLSFRFLHAKIMYLLQYLLTVPNLNAAAS